LKVGQLPFILRREHSENPEETVQFVKGQRFILIGEANIHGLSEEEELRRMKDPDDEAEWANIVLQ
jgi:hypothetical protein